MNGKIWLFEKGSYGRGVNSKNLNDLTISELSSLSYSMYKYTACTKNDFLFFIETSERFTFDERVAIENRMDMQGLLRQGLYNILYMVKNNYKGLLTQNKIASIEGLISKGFVYSINENVEMITSDYGTVNNVIKVYKLTAFGLSALDELMKNGQKLAEQERERLSKIGY